MPVKIKNGETILFIGDSITDCLHREKLHAPLGCGYVRIFADMLTVREPQKKITVANHGISGNNVGDLRDRWHDDVLEIAPDWLSIAIGINDLHHTFEGRISMPVEQFGNIYDQILSQTKKRLPDCNILLIDPFYMSRDKTSDSFRARILRALPAYIDTVHQLSRKYQTRLVKTHELFQKQLKYHKLEVFSSEPIHPNSAGHLLIAEAVYNALSL
ncbi:MAG: SGNH/GDSL hydrolase family protein [Kiritimatiellales bacterium]